jgi:hypothetical protein
LQAVVALIYAIGCAALAADQDNDLLSRLTAANERVLTAIPGCHHMEGTFSDHTDFGLLGGADHEYLVRGILRHGVWEGREVVNPDRPTGWHPAGGSGISAFGVDPSLPKGVGWGRFLLSVLPGAVSMQYVERRGSQWALVSTLDGGPRSANTMITLFDEAPFQARSVQVRIDSPIRGIEDGGHKIRILRLAMDLALSPDGVPVAETFDARLAQGIISGTSELTVAWRSRPCSG